MPEGHTIHRVARDHRQRFCGESLHVLSPQGRFQDGAEQLNGECLEQIEARGKHLFYHWDRGQILHIHLGLYGKFRSHRAPPPAPRGAVRLRIVGASHAFDLNGPTACELISADQHLAISQRLGPDPLREDADVEQAWQRIHRSRAAIGTLLLDQSVIAGVGNVYRAEALFANQLSPKRMGKSLNREQFDALWETLVEMLQIGVKYNRIVTADPAVVGKPRSRMRRDERLLCYKRLHCSRCDRKIKSWQLGARKMYACLSCQR